MLAVVFAMGWARPVDAQAARRSAVIVGANQAAPGRKPLRYSEQDARAVAAVLVELGGFAPADVHVLIDPRPSQVLSTLDRAIASDPSLLVFYYSGHADASALYPGGESLPFASLRTRLADQRVGVRLGIIDSCSGGGFTGAKGLREVEPFEVTLPLALDSEGSILIASSSGLEDAHESEQLGGSFFTHHWNAALRGAGDRNTDGQVTLAEAFDYAKTLTIRDSAMQTSSAQHPSFSLQLRGRQDLALSQLASAGAIIAVEQREGPLELVHLGTGVVLLELPKGPRKLRLAVAPGEYLLRRRSGADVWTRELTVKAGSTTRVDEAALELHGTGALAIKRASAGPRPLTLTTLPRGTTEATMWVGVSYEQRPGLSLGRSFETGAVFPHALTDRWLWILPTMALTYRGGRHGGFEWIPSGGLLGWSLGGGSLEGLAVELDPGLFLHLRSWLSPRTALTFGVGGHSQFYWQSRDSSLSTPSGTITHIPRSSPPDTWRAHLSLGVAHTVADTVTLQLGLSFAYNVLQDGSLGTWEAGQDRGGMAIGIGAVQNVGQRPAHLVQVHLSDHVALNIDAALFWNLANASAHESYLAGVSFFW